MKEAIHIFTFIDDSKLIFDIDCNMQSAGEIAESIKYLINKHDKKSQRLSLANMLILKLDAGILVSSDDVSGW